MEKHFIQLSGKNKLRNMTDIEKLCFNELHTEGISVHYMYKETNDEETDEMKIIYKQAHTIGIKTIPYKTDEDMYTYIKKLGGYVYINVSADTKVEKAHMIKKGLEQEYTKNAEFFVDKEKQREVLLKYFPESTIQYKKVHYKNIESIHIPYPWIIKPLSGTQSAGVIKVHNAKEYTQGLLNYERVLEKLQEKGFEQKEILIEEFIEGDMFSVGYFVDEKGKAKIFPPIQVTSISEHGINDFCNTVRIIDSHSHTTIPQKQIESFVQKTIDACTIRNCFVHHEFKYTPEKKLKTIEINGRIGGFRLEMYKLAYNINMLHYPFIEEQPIRNLENCVCVCTLYAVKRGIFVGRNEEIVQKIKNMSSCKKYIQLKNIGEEVGPTKEGFSRVGMIVLENSEEKQFQKDRNFLEKNYFDIIQVK